MGGLLHLVQRGGEWAGPQPAQAPPRCTKCNSPPINGQCTNFVLFDVAVSLLPLESKGLAYSCLVFSAYSPDNCNCNVVIVMSWLRLSLAIDEKSVKLERKWTCGASVLQNASIEISVTTHDAASLCRPIHTVDVLLSRLL